MNSSLPHHCGSVSAWEPSAAPSAPSGRLAFAVTPDSPDQPAPPRTEDPLDSCPRGLPNRTHSSVISPVMALS